jgi:hypothetical protein
MVMELNLIAVKLMEEEALLTYCGRIKRLLHDILKQKYLQVEQRQLSKGFIFAICLFIDLFCNIKVNAWKRSMYNM